MTDESFRKSLENMTRENVTDQYVFLDIFAGSPNEFIKEQRLQALRKKAAELGVKSNEFDALAKAMRRHWEQLKKQPDKAAELDRPDYCDRIGTPVWLNGKGIDEHGFIRFFKAAQNDPVCVNGQLYTAQAVPIADNAVLHSIQAEISPYVANRLAPRSRDLLAALKNECYTELPAADAKHIFVLNGEINVADGELSPAMRFTFYRLNVTYEPDAPKPTAWLAYLADLLIDDDILTLQEFLGYCLIPTTKAQKMLFLIGSGGEGKSVIGVVMKAIFGNALAFGSLNSLEARFGLLQTENKLLFVDDDLKTEGLRESANIKTLVTAAAPISIERKGKDPYNAPVHCRLMCFGNRMANTLFDHSDGVYRRRLILHTKPRPTERNDNRTLADEIIAQELPAVFNWLLEGLRRLIANNYEFTVSETAAQLAQEAKENDFNPIAFFADPEAVVLGDMSKNTSTADLYGAYVTWCRENGFVPVRKKTFTDWLRGNAVKFGLRYNKNLYSETGNKVRGYDGVALNRYAPYTGSTPFDTEGA